MRGEDISLAEFRYARDFQDPAITRQSYAGDLANPQSFAAQALQIPSQLARMQSAAAAGDFTRAKGFYDSVVSFYRDFSDDVARGVVLDARGDELLTAIKHASVIGASREYDSTEIVTPQGKRTAGEVFGPGGLYETMRGDELKAANFSDAVVHLVGSDDPELAELRSLVTPLTDTITKSAAHIRAPGSIVPGAGQYNALAHHLAVNGAKDIADVGIDAVRAAVGQIGSKHMNDGTAIPMYKWLIKTAAQEKLANVTGYDGAGVVNHLASSFDATLTAVAGGKDGRVADSATRAVALAVISATAGSGIDLDDPWTRQGIAELVDVLAVGERAGVKFFPMVQTNGGQVSKALAAYIQACSQGLEAPENNLITNLSMMHHFLRENIAPGWTPASTSSKADPRAEVGQASGVLRRTSGSEALDVAAVGAYRAFARRLTPWIASGSDAATALQHVLSDPGERTQLVEGLAQELARTMAVPTDAAQGIALAFLNRMDKQASGAAVPAGLENAITDFAFLPYGEELPHMSQDEIRRVDAAKEYVGQWYAGHVGEAGRYYDQLLSGWDRILYDPVLGYGGLKPNALAMAIASLKNMAKGRLHEATTQGMSPDILSDVLKTQGRYYQIVGYEKDGQVHIGTPAPKDLATAVPIVRETFGPLDKATQPVKDWVVGGMVIPSYGPRAFSEFGFETFRSYQEVLQRIYQVQQTATVDVVKNAFSSEPD